MIVECASIDIFLGTVDFWLRNTGPGANLGGDRHTIVLLALIK